MANIGTPVDGSGLYAFMRIQAIKAHYKSIRVYMTEVAGIPYDTLFGIKRRNSIGEGNKTILDEKFGEDNKYLKLYKKTAKELKKRQFRQSAKMK